MLLHELSSHKGRLLLSVLMLKDANPDHYAVPGVDKVVSHESRQFADDGHKAFLAHLRHLLRVTHALVAPYCNVHPFSLPPSHRGRADQARLKLYNAATLASGDEFPVNSWPTSENSVPANFHEKA